MDTATREEKASVTVGSTTAGNRGAIARAFVFLAYFLASFLLRQLSLEPDGIVYLDRIDKVRHTDLMHYLYVPTLRILEPLFGGDAQLGALVLSALCGALFVLALWRLLEVLGIQLWPALAATLCVACCLPFWTSAATVEVYTPANAALVVTLLLAARYGQDRKWWRVPLIGVTTILAAGFHAFTLLAAPAVLYLMSTRKRIRLSQASILLVVIALLATMLIYVLDPRMENVKLYLTFARSLLPDPEAFKHPLEMLGRNSASVLGYLTASPPFLALPVLGLIIGWKRYPTACRLSLIWGIPFLLAFLVLSVSFLGLLLPLTAALAVAIAAGAQRVIDRHKRWSSVICAVTLVVSIFWVSARAIPPMHDAATRMLPHAEMALLIDQSAPANACIFAGGKVALYLRFSGKLRLISVAAERRLTPHAELARFVDKLKSLAAQEAAQGYRPYLSSDAILLLERFEHDDVDSLLAPDPPIDLTNDNVELTLHAMIEPGD